MKHGGHTARAPRAGVAGRAGLLALRSLLYVLAVPAGLAAVVALLGGDPNLGGRIEGPADLDPLAASLLAAGLGATVAIIAALVTTARRTAPALLRGVRTGQVATASAWCVAITGFVVYLASVDSFMEAYGGVGTGGVLLLWLTLFSVLYYTTTDRLIPARRVIGPATAGMAVAIAWLITFAALAGLTAGFGSIGSPYWVAGAIAILLAGMWAASFALLRSLQVDTAAPRPSPLADRVDRVVVPSAALRNTTAQGRMMSVLGTRAARMSGRESEMMDWGFAYGVAWAVARSQDPRAPEELVSERALHTTQAVYLAYRGSASPPLDATPPAPLNGGANGSGGGSSAAQAHAHRS